MLSFILRKDGSFSFRPFCKANMSYKGKERQFFYQVFATTTPIIRFLFSRRMALIAAFIVAPEV